MAHDEFESEMPATEMKTFKTGAKVEDDGAYFCTNCGPIETAPMVNLKKGDMIPPCAECSPLSRWAKV